MGNAATGALEQEQAEGYEARNSVGAASGMSDPAPTLQKKQPAPPQTSNAPRGGAGGALQRGAGECGCMGDTRAHTKTQRSCTLCVTNAGLGLK